MLKNESRKVMENFPNHSEQPRPNNPESLQDDTEDEEEEKRKKKSRMYEMLDRMLQNAQHEVTDSTAGSKSEAVASADMELIEKIEDEVTNTEVIDDYTEVIEGATIQTLEEWSLDTEEVSSRLHSALESEEIIPEDSNVEDSDEDMIDHPSPLAGTSGGGGDDLPPFDGRRSSFEEFDGGDRTDRATVAESIEYTPSRIASSSVETPTNPAVESSRRRSGKDLLTGAVLGYFVGKRRGRQKAEKIAEKQISELESQLKKFQEQLAVSSNIVRQEVSKNYDNDLKRTEITAKAGETRSQIQQKRRIGEGVLSSESIKRPQAERLTDKQIEETAGKIEVMGEDLLTHFNLGRLSRTGMRKVVEAVNSGKTPAEAFAMYKLGESVIAERRFERAPGTTKQLQNTATISDDQTDNNSTTSDSRHSKYSTTIAQRQKPKPKDNPPAEKFSTYVAQEKYGIFMLLTIIVVFVIMLMIVSLS